MFKQLQITNFQSHKDTKLNFCSGVNVVAGKSQSGKTAILRALKLLTENRPLGFRFHSNFSDKPTQVGLTLQDDTRIAFTKDEQGTTYRLNKKEYAKVGSNVPDLVTKALNLTEINTQAQLEEPFLITSAPGQVARVINQIVRMEDADHWTRQLTTFINSTTKEVRLLEDQRKGLESKLDEYGDLPELEKLVEKAEALDKELQEATQERDELKDISYRLGELDKDIEDLSGWLEEVEDLLQKAVAIAEQQRRATDELLLLERAVELDNEVKGLEEWLRCGEKVKEANNIMKKLERLEAERFALNELAQELEDLGMDIAEAESDEHKAKKAYGELLGKLGICPTCFTGIGKKKAAEIVKQL